MEWRAIKGYQYEISENGEIRSLDKISERRERGKLFYRELKGKTLRPYINGGYKKCMIVENHVSKVKHIHRLVYESFCGDLIPGKCIHHKDGNKLNNHYSNLEQTTYKQHNNIHKHEGHNKGGKMPQSQIEYIKKIKSSKIFPKCLEAFELKSSGVNYLDIAKKLKVGPRQVYYLISRYEEIINKKENT